MKLPKEVPPLPIQQTITPIQITPASPLRVQNKSQQQQAPPLKVQPSNEKCASPPRVHPNKFPASPLRVHQKESFASPLMVQSQKIQRSQPKQSTSPKVENPKLTPWKYGPRHAHSQA